MWNDVIIIQSTIEQRTFRIIQPRVVISLQHPNRDNLALFPEQGIEISGFVQDMSFVEDHFQLFSFEFAGGRNYRDLMLVAFNNEPAAEGYQFVRLQFKQILSPRPQPCYPQYVREGELLAWKEYGF